MLEMARKRVTSGVDYRPLAFAGVIGLLMLLMLRSEEPANPRADRAEDSGDAAAAAALASPEAFLADAKAAKARHGYALDQEVSVVERAPYLAIGGRPGEGLLAFRSAAGRRVTHVVNCLAADEEPAIRRAFAGATRLLTLALADDGDDAKLRAALPRAAEFVRAARADDPDCLVYVHCQSGVNRAPSVAMAVLVAEERRSLVWAFARVRAARASVRPKYVKEVAIFEEATLGRSSAPAMRDGPDSAQFCEMYYGLKNDHSGREAGTRPGA
jgi:predicted protein tyrosine phosphatase